MGTVTGIIDGTGSLGAAFGQIIVSTQWLKFVDWSDEGLLFRVEPSLCRHGHHDLSQLIPPPQGEHKGVPRDLDAAEALKADARTPGGNGAVSARLFVESEYQHLRHSENEAVLVLLSGPALLLLS